MESRTNHLFEMPGFGPSANVIPTLPDSGSLATKIPILPENRRITYVRFLLAAPLTPSVDVYVNRVRVVSNLSFAGFTNYFSAVPGTYNITVYPAGNRTNPLLSTRITLRQGRVYTAVINGEPQDLSIRLITDRVRNTHAENGFLRIAHFVPNITGTDVYLDKRMIISDLQYREVSPYSTLASGFHHVQFRITGTNMVILNASNVSIESGIFTTGYFLGYSGGADGMELLTMGESLSYSRA